MSSASVETVEDPIDIWMTIIRTVVVVVVRFATWNVYCMWHYWSAEGNWISGLLIRKCPEVKYVGLKGSLDKAHKGLEIRQACISPSYVESPCRWQCENPVFFSGGTSWILTLLPIILRSGVHKVGWIANHILQWPKSPMPLIFVWGLKHVVDFMKLVGCTLEGGTTVWIDCLWFPLTCYVMPKGSKNASVVRLVTTSMCTAFVTNRKLHYNSLLLFCCLVFPIIMRWVQHHLNLLWEMVSSGW